MRRLVIVPLVAGAAFISSILATPAFSADNGTVSATVSVTGPCLQLASSQVTFPATKFGTSAGPGYATQLGPTITNCGSTADIHAKGTNASGPNSASWALTAATNPSTGCTVSGELMPTDKYAVKYYNGGTDEKVLALSNAAIKLGLAQNATIAGYSIDLFLPCTGSSGGGSVMAFSVIFTAIVP